MSDFTSLANQKAFLGVATATTTWDTILASLITQVTKLIKDYCQDEIEDADYVEDYDGWGQDRLLLKHRPINSIAYVREDFNRAFASSTNIDTSLYAYDSGAGVVIFIGYGLSAGIKNVRVSYNAGYATLPDSVVLATHMWVAHVFEQRKDRGLTNQSLGNRSFGLDLSAIPVDVALILEPYRSVVASA